MVKLMALRLNCTDANHFHRLSFNRKKENRKKNGNLRLTKEELPGERRFDT